MPVRFRPAESKEFVLNPHKGCATFQRFNGDPLYEGTRWSEYGPTEFPAAEREVVDGYLPCTVAYCRWYWRQFEREEGKVDFSMVERSLETARERGQTLQVRLMPLGTGDAAPPRWYCDRYETPEMENKRAPYLGAVYDSREFLDNWARVITEFGERFDGHPGLESVDVSFIGPWGEGAGECSEENIDWMTGVYREAHPKTPLVAMIAGYKMTAGVRAGAGWRCDCFGDLGFWRDEDHPEIKSWNHHYDSYPQSVARCGAADAWRTAPVVFESCGVPARWLKESFDLDFILRQGRKFHGSVLMPKSCAIPGEYMEPLADFCNDLGYRYVLRQLTTDGLVERGGAFQCELWIENVGVAPVYRRYDLVLRLTQGAREHVHRSDRNILEWLPGDAVFREEVRPPEEFEAGKVEIHAALVHPETGEPRVRFANDGTDEEGWLALGEMELK